MAITYVRGPNPIWFFNNLTGQVLDDTYYAFFLTNDLPYIPQAVFQDPNGISPWPNPIEFQPSGGLPNNLYFNPTEVYRIEIRQGPDQTSPLIWLVQNYVPGDGGSGGSTIVDQLTVSANLITNPNFSDVYFTSPLTYTQASPGTYTVNVAPGWQLVLTGSGTTVLTQGTFAGDSNTFGNPTYFLEINNTGWTSAILTQTLSNNGAIFANGAIAVAFTAQAITTGQAVIVNYVPNGPSNSQTIVSAPVTTGGFAEYYGAINLNASANTNTDGAANVQIQFVLPGTGHVELTNIQVVGQSTPLSVNFVTPPSTILQGSVPNYQEQTYEQIVNGEFNVYKQPLFYKQIPSYLVGWDFPLNPAQFAGASSAVAAKAVGANKSYYAWDQTILFQSANSAITTSRGAAGDLKILAAATTQMAVIQYLPAIQARKILNDYISVNLSALSSVAATGTIKATVSLWYTKDASLPSAIGSNNSLVLTLDANGKPATFNGNWIEVPPLNLEEAVALIASSSTTNFNDYSFNGWWNLAGVADVNAATFFAIVVGTASITLNDFLRINSVGLCSGKIATRPAPQTQDEALRTCQFYFEMSYDIGTVIGTATTTGSQFAPQLINAAGHPVAGQWSLDFMQVKYKAPGNLTFYSALNANVSAVVSYNSINGAVPVFSGDITWATYFSYLGLSTERASFNLVTGAAIDGGAATSSYLFYHYTCDSRLGQ